MKKKIFGVLLAGALCSATLAGCGIQGGDAHGEQQVQTSETANSGAENYKPVTITVDLERGGLGDKIEETFTKPPTHIVAKGDQMADYFFDLGLENNIAGYTHGGCWSTVSQYPARAVVPLLGDVNGQFTKEELLAADADFLIGWDSTFSDKNFNKDFCKENGIAMYTPYCTSDSATFEDIYRDYETLGKIFGVEDLAAEKVGAMKATLASVKEALGEEVYSNPVSVFAFDSGESGPFTACQGMPGDIFKLAGGISIFDDIKKGWATVSWEQVVERNPQVIVILDYNGEAPKKMDFLYSNKAMANVDAIKNKRVISASACDIQGTAGSAKLVEYLAKSLYPDKFQ